MAGNQDSIQLVVFTFHLALVVDRVIACMRVELSLT